MKKTFVVTMFGEPFSWINDFVNQVQFLEKDGWYWKIFTPAKLESKGNVEFIEMNCDGFNKLIKKKLGLESLFFLHEGHPSIHITDYYVFTGKLFEDYLKDSDYWGIANLDIVCGNLSKFLPDSELEKYDVWTDDSISFNGTFSLMRNTDTVNHLYEYISGWKKMIEQLPCLKCIGKGGEHQLFGSDEYAMTEVLKGLGDKISYGHPKYYPLLSHDRLEQHVPEVKLEIKEDGSLYELFKDINGPRWIHEHPIFGKEIMWFHFQRTKEWPKCLKKQ